MTYDRGVASGCLHHCWFRNWDLQPPLCEIKSWESNLLRLSGQTLWPLTGRVREETWDRTLWCVRRLISNSASVFVLTVRRPSPVSWCSCLQQSERETIRGSSSDVCFLFFPCWRGLVWLTEPRSQREAELQPTWVSCSQVNLDAVLLSLFCLFFS